MAESTLYGTLQGSSLVIDYSQFIIMLIDQSMFSKTMYCELSISL